MIQWKEKRKIPANIEQIWSLFQPDQLQRIMPKVVKHELIDHVEGEIGTTYEQSYQEGKRVVTYIVETLDYSNQEDYKHLKVGFNIGKAFRVETAYTIEKKDDNHSVLTYEGVNQGTNWFGKLMLKMARSKGNDKVINGFLDRVKEEATKESN
ncbi:SRPBCC family protein [Alkalibacillus aidingensis]|uniref:SRPBCC family protein n=1 Tax=Alkalibacillus aidingensis TaxID=2747607 RepID=UPI0016601C34|nr:SRPBCC family protein [Alkalibacillus aidingensis]